MGRWLTGLLALPLAAGPAVTATPQWVLGPDMPTPAGALGSEWHDISATAATDVWAVGGADDAPLTGHFDGTTWTEVPTPAVPDGFTYDLSAVDGAGVDDAWTVGTADELGQHDQLLAWHYDGRSWSAPAGAVPPIPDSSLADVDMLTRDDGWAVGHYSTIATRGLRPLVLHYTDGKWSRVINPIGDAISADLTAVHALATDDVWAVGTQSRIGGKQDTIVLHYDGIRWQEITTPIVNPVGESATLLAVAAISGKDVWAAGKSCLTLADDSCHAVVLHLTPTGWTIVPTTGLATELTAVLPLAPGDVWIIGYASSKAENEYDLAEHWDGTSFTRDPQLPLPAPDYTILDGEPGSALEAATIVPGTGAIWAAGWYRSPLKGTSHIIHRG
ncbi:hypothetical protein [Winogradskya humida]|uniref:Photosynthesis system II assembly factor YCF48-like protein n=1 Tax=Winogradskya humida TaxID=113566 RepID=A0ABQ4A6J6_9ACTN|nr:hypothetical protein [Actinoplanes humidus]GIE26485.1 hypothetical protein Ahu01nite_095870 [Actinoplanes humidus]